MAQAYVWSNKDINSAELANLYEWLDRVPLSRPRTTVEKDFADGCLAAEIVKHYFPSFADLRDYHPSPNIQDRISQWKNLNVKVFRRIGLIVPAHMATQLSICKTGIAQILLSNLRACLTMAGANTYDASSKSMISPQMRGGAQFYGMRGAGDGGGGGVGGGGRGMGAPRGGRGPRMLPLVYNDEFDYYWQQKQAARAMNARNGGRTVIISRATAARDPKSFSDPNLMMKSGNFFVPTFLPPASRIQQNYKSGEMDTLRNQVKRMEMLLQAKNSKIHELEDELAANRAKRPFNR